MSVKKSPGVTLTELMVAVAIISIAALGMIGSFQAIAVGVQHAKMRTLAANIAVEVPESEVDSTHYRILFLAALVLFMFSFVVNTLAEIVRQRLRRKYSNL